MALSVGLNAAQRQFFFRARYLILQEILTRGQCAALVQELKGIWAARALDAGKPVSQATRRQTGRDLWRDSPLWSSKLLRSPIGSLALQLWSQTQLRLLFDQALLPLPIGGQRDAYTFFSLASASAFEGIEGGILICLDPCKADAWQLSIEHSIKEGSDEHAASSELPQEVGTGVFIGRDLFMRMQWTTQHPVPTSGLWMLCAFGNLRARYVFNENDPSRHALSALDYTIGEPLRDSTHPLIKSSSGASMR